MRDPASLVLPGVAPRVLGPDEVHTLLTMSREIAAARDEGAVAQAVARGLEDLFPGRAFCLRFLDRKSLSLTSLHAHGRLRAHARVVLRRAAVRKTGLCEDALVACGLAVGERDEPVLEGCERATAVPLAVGGELFGVLHVEYGPGVDGEPEQDEPLLLQIANHTAVAAKNLRTLEEVTYLKGFLEDLIENANALVLVADRARRLLVFNRALRRLTGLEKDEALGADLAELVVPEERARVTAALARAFDGEPVAGFETRLRVKGGGEARVLVNTSSLWGSSGEVEGMIAIGQDTTALRALERSAEQAQRLAELGQLAAGIVHELNNPLTAVTIYSETLHEKLARSPGAEPGDLEKLRTIREAGDRLLRFSRDLMAYARPAPERVEAVDAAALVEQAARMCEPALRRAQARLERRFEPIPAVHGVKASLLQLFVNLLTNAAQALPPAGGTVEVALAPAGEGIALRVKDDGCGMTPDVRRRIFEPFFSTKADRDGTGLGLCIAQRIVLRHGGRIGVESAPGAGTEITVTLPLRAPA
jgi:PAS domain S-box-containing protein